MTLLDAAVAAEDIRDIRGPIPVDAPLPYAAIAAALLAAAALALTLTLVYRRLRRRQPSVYQQARRRVEEAREHALEGPADELAERVSGAIRDYVESRFTLRAAHSTTEELLADLLRGADAKLTSYRDELARFLGTCDLAKFAGRDLPPELRRELCGDAMDFLSAAEASVLRGESK